MAMKTCPIVIVLLLSGALLFAQGTLLTVDDFYFSGIHKLSEKDYFGAAADLKVAYELDTTDARICRALAYSLYNTGDYEGSARFYQRTLSIEPDDWQSTAQLAVVCMSEDIQDFDAAIQYAERATQLNPSSDLALYTLANAYERAGRYDDAERYYRHFMETFLDSEHRNEVARALKKLNKDVFVLTYKILLENQDTEPATSVRALVMLGQDFHDYQKTVLLSADPRFNAVMSDSLGNKFVEYRFDQLDPGQTTEITFDYLVEIRPTMYEISAPADATPTVSLAPYLMPQQLIECNSQAIVSKADTITSGAADAHEKARRIYDYVTNTLTYNIQTQSLGAEYALAHPEQADCTEFTALFVALCRASAVPARPVFGFGRLPEEKHFTTSHAWAEFYLNDFGWIPVDPTYGSRYAEEYFGRIDANHIA
ncbi:MAG: transglutaminase domain-containing protein, partial [bacterium]